MKIYGETAIQVVYWKFENDTGLARSKIYLHPDQFVQALHSIFGGETNIVARTMIAAFKRVIPHFEPSDLGEALMGLRRHVKEISITDRMP